MKKTTIAIACAFMALGLITTNAWATIILTPDSTALFLFGNDTSQNAIDQILEDNGVPVPELYKENRSDGSEAGAFAPYYDTTFFNMGTDPQSAGAQITWTGPEFINSDPAYFLIKDGSSEPAWYLFEVFSWDGKETVRFENFFPNHDFTRISHVSIYGANVPSKVPDGGMALMLLGGALIGIEGLRRKWIA